jgi:uncharacterized protein
MDASARDPFSVGIGLRRPHFRELLHNERRVDFLELVPEVFLGVGGETRRVLHALRERYPMLVHGVSLSLGGPDPLTPRKLADLAALCRELDAPYYSDHVCLSSIDGIETFDLLPLPFTEAAALHVATRCRAARERMERPIALENITYYAKMPGSAWTEGQFLSAMLEASDAELLLDVSNVLANAQNHGLDPQSALDALPLARTRQIHLAGQRFDSELQLQVDDHASAVSEASLALYEHALRRIGRPVPTLIEWDQNLPSLDALLDLADLVRARQAAVFEAPLSSAATSTAGR